MRIPKPSDQDRILRNDFGSIENAKDSKSARAPHIQKAVGYSTDFHVGQLRIQFAGGKLRPDVVTTAKQQLASGELLNRAAAVETAQALIGIVKNF